MSSKEQRQKEVLDYIISHPGVKTSQLREDLGLAKSSLCDILKNLQSKGYRFDQSAHGQISFISISNTVSANPEYAEDINNKIIRQWLLLYVFNYVTSTMEDAVRSDMLHHFLTNAYQHSGSPQSLPALYMFRKDLRSLVQEGYLQATPSSDNYKQYTATNLTSRMIIIDSEIANYFLSLHAALPNRIFLDSLYTSLCALYPDTNNGLKEIQSEILDAISIIQEFMSRPFYKTNCINMTVGKQDYRDFQVGLIFYSKEKNRFYLLGASKNSDTPNQLIPLKKDAITNLEPSDQANSIYRSEKTLQIYEYMLEASLDKPSKSSNEYMPEESLDKPSESSDEYMPEESLDKPSESSDEYIPVDMYIVKTEANTLLMDELKSHRETTASVEYIKASDCQKSGVTLTIASNANTDLIHYTDKVLGVGDLKRFVRSFGDQIQVIKPSGLICANITLWKKRYKESFEEEYKENIDERL